MMRRWLHSIADGLPARCALCHAWPARPVCEACIARFAQPRARCSTCALPLAQPGGPCAPCLRTRPILSACVAAVDYAYPWSRLLMRFKFLDEPGWAPVFGQLMRHAPWAEPLLERAQALIPVPLSTSRLRQRGFNQALALAQALDPSRADPHTLLRIQETATQSRSSRRERLGNLKGAFAVHPLRVGRVRGRRLLLIDDVMTTGATLHAAAGCLLAAGAAEVGALVLARVDRPERPEQPDPA